MTLLLTVPEWVDRSKGLHVNAPSSSSNSHLNRSAHSECPHQFPTLHSHLLSPSLLLVLTLRQLLVLLGSGLGLDNLLKTTALLRTSLASLLTPPPLPFSASSLLLFLLRGVALFLGAPVPSVEVEVEVDMC